MVSGPVLRTGLLRRVELGPGRLGRLLKDAPGPDLAAKVCAVLGLRLELPPAELMRLPPQGGLLLLADRPYGLIEACALLPSLRERRGDWSVFADPLLESDAAAAGGCLGPGGWDERRRRALERLQAGEAVLAFMGGAMAFGRCESRASMDEAEAWAGLARAGKASVQSLRLRGGKRLPWLKALGLDKPGWRRLALQRALPQAAPKLMVSLGAPLPPAELLQRENDREAGEMLLLKRWLLTRRGVDRPRKAPAWRLPVGAAAVQPLASALPAAMLEVELGRLPQASRLAVHGELECWVARSAEIPLLMREIGRLREETFRAVGEGTGRPLDLDRFDAHYRQLFLWHRGKRELVGGYRFTPVDEAMALQGLDGLYTHSLLRFKPELIQRLEPALEMGRSFVTGPWQRDYAPLQLLWKGIGAWVAAHPKYRRLFGLVSMSADYQGLSRELVASFIKQHLYLGDLARMTRPLKPYRPAYLPNRHDPKTWRLGGDLERFSRWVSELEPDGKGLPVLFRQYARLGGLFFGFNVDPAFGGALDGMVCVDLVQADPRMLQRHMGEEAARRYLEHHGQAARA